MHHHLDRRPHHWKPCGMATPGRKTQWLTDDVVCELRRGLGPPQNRLCVDVHCAGLYSPRMRFQAGWRRKFGRRQEMPCWSEILKKTSGSVTQRITDGERKRCPLGQDVLNSPHPCKGGRRSDTKRWWGLAVILAVDGPNRYFVGCRNRTLLLAADFFAICFVCGASCR